MIAQYLASLRSIYLIHQTNHWQCHNYAQHLLFERIYQDVIKDIDATAEKLINLFGSDSANLINQMEMMNSFCKKWSSENIKVSDQNKKYLYSSLQAEKDFQKLSEEIYKELKEKEEITLGLDDLIMSNHNNSESRTYLLVQSLKDD